MLKNYVKITFRSLMKSKMFVFINIMGLGISLACCIVAYLNYNYGTQFDSDQENISEIYRVDFVREFEGRSRKHGFSPLPLGYVIQDNIPDLEVVRYHPGGGNVRVNDELFPSNFRYVDENFFDVFTFPMLYGRKEDLSDRSKVFISYQMAERLFGNENPVGLPLTQVLDSTTREYTIAGVIDKMQDNSSFSGFQIITHWENLEATNPVMDPKSWNVFSTVFLHITEPSRIPAIETQLQQYVEPQNLAREDFKVTRYFLEPFEGMAQRSDAERIGSFLSGGMPAPAITVPGIMAILILLIACFNFTNTSIAISSRRLKEIGLRKVMGGLRKQLVIQFLAENIVLCLVALAVGLLIAEYLVPEYSEMWPFLTLELVYSQNLGFLGFIVGLLLMTGLVAGAYPAFYISGFDPTQILKGTQKFKGAGTFPKILLGLQYFISLLAVIMGVAFVQNAQYQQDLDTGFQEEGIVIAPVQNYNEFEVLRNSVSSHPDVELVGGSEYQFYGSQRNDPIRFEDKQIESDILHIGDGYFEAMGMELLSGRNFVKDSESDKRESALVSTAFIEAMGWTDDPIGKRIVWADTVSLYIIGTVKDVYAYGFWEPVDPMVVRYVSEEDYRYLTVKSSPGKVVEVNEFIKQQWEEIFPNRIYGGRFLDQEINEALLVNKNIITMFLFLGIIAAILSATGLFTLVSLNIIKRMKEIGVRKVLGASIMNIATSLNKQFFIILIISAALGSALGSFLGNGLMGSIWFYHVPMNIPSGVIAVLIMLLVSVATIGYKVYNAATVNPVKTLRSE